MNQYQNQYGTVYAVRDYKGAPQIMCRAKDDGDWLVSGTLAVQAAAAKTADEMQAVLDQHATAHGWQPVDEQAPASAEPQEIVDEGSGPEDGFPDWVRPMVEAFLRFPFFRELPAFTAFALRHSEPVQHRQGGSLADGLYDTGSKGIKFSVFRGNNSDHYREASYTWADFVRRCKAAGLAPEQLHQDKEDAPCKINPPAPAAQPSKEPPTELAPTAPTNPPAFDFGALDADTAEKLRGITDRVMELYQSYAWGMAYQVGRAHDLLCGDSDRCETVSQRSENGQFAKKEKTFTAWCAYIGVERRSAYNLLNAYRLICKATPEQQKNLQLAPAKLLYETGKKDVPDHLVNAVLDGDITKTKQFLDAKREWQAQLDAEKAAREQAEQEREQAISDRDSARDAQMNFSNIADRIAKQRDKAERDRDEALKQRDGAREALAAAKLRGDKWQAEAEALKAQPVEAQVVDEEEIDRRAQARANELTAPLREELEALRNRHPADLEEAEQAIRDAYDSAVYTGRVIESAWRSLCPLLPRMDADRRELALNQIVKIISTIQGECIQCL